MKKYKFFWHILFMGILSFFFLFGIFIWMNSYTKHGDYIVVPQLVGEEVNASEKLLTDLGLQYEIVDSLYVNDVPVGTVLEVTPEGGTKVKPNRLIFLKINAFSPRLVELPLSLSGMSQRQAKATLKGLGFAVKGLTKVEGKFNGLVVGVESLTGDSIPLGTKLKEGMGLMLQVTSTEVKELVPRDTTDVADEILQKINDEPIVVEDAKKDDDEESWW